MRICRWFFKIIKYISICVLAYSLYVLFVGEPINVGDFLPDEITLFSQQGESESLQEEVQAGSVETEESEKSEDTAEIDVSIIESGITSITFSEEIFDSERLDFYSYYFQPSEDFASYEDYERTIGYMLIHNISECEIVVENPGYYDEDVVDVIEEIANAHGDLQLILTPYVDLWSQFNVYADYSMAQDGLVTEIIFGLVLSGQSGMPEDAIITRVVSANAYANSIIDQMYEMEYLSDDMEDKEKIYVIYSYIVNTIEYNYDTIEAIDNGDLEYYNESRDFYTALVEKSSVCQGIASAMIQLCRMVDVPLYVQYGYADGNAHSWCKYQLEDESWIYFDPTWAICDLETLSYHPTYWCWVTQEFMEENTRNGREFVDYLT